MFHKKCQACGTKYYLSYHQDSDGVKYFREGSISCQYIILSSRTCFEVCYIKTMSDLIENTGVAFSAIAESYECTHSDYLEPQRLEEAYYVLRLLPVYNSNQE